MTRSELLRELNSMKWLFESEIEGINFFMKKFDVRVRIYINADDIIREILIEDDNGSYRLEVEETAFKMANVINNWRGKSPKTKNKFKKFYNNIHEYGV